ncbi:MAG: transcriptional regulator [Nocardia sp.]|uniref:winged helix-turn-helix transcriptional regulator n=1 Tax=Nocardia sp. TaxID=1821 RepID=UPI0026113C97|nr:helix-turn-helix domain-containing protein [Nocardia sp.]MCU1644082.1 transcriptional regulator [Nocardia sp.]
MDTMVSGHDVPALPAVNCPKRAVVEVLANKWALLVLGTLNENTAPMRFNQLGRSIEGITQKMLTQTLRTLERDGLVRREVYPTRPLRVEYDLTPLGTQIAELVEVISQWAFTHINEIYAAREAFDIQERTPPIAR